MIKSLLIDYAGVLTPTKDNYRFVEQFHEEYHIPSKRLMELSYRNWPQSATDKMKSQLYWEKLAELIGTDPKRLRKNIMDTYPLDKKLINYLERMTKQYTLVLVSNQIRDWLEEVIDKNDLNAIFDYTANSYEVGVRKPNHKIFNYALNLIGSKPKETVFVDDMAKNIEAAQELGIHTINYSDFASFERDLNNLLKIA